MRLNNFRKHVILIVLNLLTVYSYSQNVYLRYYSLISKAETFNEQKKYLNSSLAYDSAFKVSAKYISQNDYYNAACSFALSNKIDAAFKALTIIARQGKYADYTHIAADSDLIPLHPDHRWNNLIETIKKNEVVVKAHFNYQLVEELNQIFVDDQKYRLQMDDSLVKYGFDSNPIKLIEKKMTIQDDEDLIKIAKIIDTYGWLGEDVIGHHGNKTIFIVIQHADHATQMKYLPIMREAVKLRKANGSDLAYLEDRVAIDQGKKQIYGTQIHTNQSGKDSILPIDDEINVDVRREALGMEPLEIYALSFKIKYVLPKN